MASLPLTLSLEGPLLLAFAGPPHVDAGDGTDAAPAAVPSPVEARPNSPDSPAAPAPSAVPPKASAPTLGPAAPATGPIRTRLRFVGVGSTVNANVLPFSYSYSGGVIGFELEAGGFYRRKPRLGSAFTLGVIPNAYYYFPRFVVAHRLYVRNLLLAKPDFRVESLTNFDAGLGVSLSLPGIHLAVGWSTRLVFRDRFFLNVKPVSFEVTAPDFMTGLFVSARYGAALTMGTAF